LKIVDYESIERTAKAIKELILKVDKGRIERSISEEIKEEMKYDLEFNIYDCFLLT